MTDDFTRTKLRLGILFPRRPVGQGITGEELDYLLDPPSSPTPKPVCTQPERKIVADAGEQEKPSL